MSILPTEQEVIDYSTKDGEHCQLAVDVGVWAIKTTGKQILEWLEEYVFYVDSRGYIALKPDATKNWQQLKKECE